MVELETIQIIRGTQISEVEEFAVKELQRYLRMLFSRELAVSNKIPDKKTPLILIGNPKTNPVLGNLDLATHWPQASDQGVVLKYVLSDNRPVWLVGGGSPAATLWAVYELIERLGVRYLLSGDVFPDAPGPLALPEIDEHREPVFQDRMWRLMNDEPHGPEMWSLDECRRVIDQLAKLKVNKIFLHTYAYHPFVHYEFRGIKKSTATLNFGLKYPIDENTIGREHFGDVEEFINPEFQNCRTYEDWVQTGQRYAREVYAHAKSRGMNVGLSFSLTDVAQEFKDNFHKWSPTTGESQGEQGATDFVRLGVVTMGTPPRNRSFQDVDNPALLELSELIVKTHVETYPELDFIMLGSAEFRNSVTGYEKCWRHLDEKYGIESVVPLEQVIDSARSRFYHGEGRAEREVKADIEFIYFVDKLFREKGLAETLAETFAKTVTERPGRDEIQIVINPVTEELHPILGHVLPDNFAISSVIDYNLTLGLSRIESLASFADARIDHYHILSLQDDIQSLLISSEGARIDKYLETMRRYRFKGWSSRYWSIGDLDHSTLYLARASWDSQLKLSDAYDDYIHSLCGEACLPEMREALRLLEENTALQGTDLFGVGFPYPGLMQRHFDMGRHFEGNLEPRKELLQCRDCYIRVRNLVRVAAGKARPEAAGRLRYMIGRLTTCAFFMETAYTVEAAGIAYRAAQQARDDRDPDAITHHLNNAAKALKEALGLSRKTIQAHLDIIRDESDLGLLAAMNEYMHKYLKARSILVSHEASNWHL